MILTTTQQYCSVCLEVTLHKNGHCDDCEHEEIRNETIRWMRMKSKCLMIVTATVCLVAINWAMAQDYSKDDIVRTALGSLASAIAIWFSSSKKREDKVQ